MQGRVWKFGDNVNTDEIIPASYLNITDPRILAGHCMEGIDKDFAGKVSEGDIIVAGRNFGCGSSREHAPLAIKGAGLSCLIAESFARIFYRNAVNIGLPILECTQAPVHIKDGDVIEVNLSAGNIKNLTSDESWCAQPFPAFMQKIIASGGLMKYVRKK